MTYYIIITVCQLLVQVTGSATSYVPAEIMGRGGGALSSDGNMLVLHRLVVYQKTTSIKVTQNEPLTRDV